MRHSQALESLHRIIRGSARCHEMLAPHTSIHIGGPADFFAQPADEADVVRVVAWARSEGIAYRVLGLGSNLLVPDDGYRGLILSLKDAANFLTIEGRTVRVGAGYPLTKLVNAVARQGLAGMTGLAGIPGSVGGALAMNAGTREGEMGDVVTRVRVLTPEGEIVELRREELGYSYRHSRLLDENLVALSAELVLADGNADQLIAQVRQNAQHRHRTQPLNLPNTGSVWMNPPGDYAGRLLQEAGLKGLRYGQAQISEKHGNFIVNLGDARAAEVLILMRTARQTVHDQFGILLQPEVRWLEGQEVFEQLLSPSG